MWRRTVAPWPPPPISPPASSRSTRAPSRSCSPTRGTSAPPRPSPRSASRRWPPPAPGTPPASAARRQRHPRRGPGPRGRPGGRDRPAGQRRPRERLRRLARRGGRDRAAGGRGGARRLLHRGLRRRRPSTTPASPGSGWRPRSRRTRGRLVLTARAENHIRDVQDLDDTIARLQSFQEAGRRRALRARSRAPRPTSAGWSSRSTGRSTCSPYRASRRSPSWAPSASAASRSAAASPWSPTAPSWRPAGSSSTRAPTAGGPPPPSHRSARRRLRLSSSGTWSMASQVPDACHGRPYTRTMPVKMGITAPTRRRAHRRSGSCRTSRRPATSPRRSRRWPTASTGASGSRRCSASPARASPPPSPGRSSRCSGPRSSSPPTSRWPPSWPTSSGSSSRTTGSSTSSATTTTTSPRPTWRPRDTYIEKDSSVNDEIERLRHSTTASLLTRRDVIVVASVSCIYGLGSPEEYRDNLLVLKKGETHDQRAILRKLVDMQYERNDMNLTRGKFRVRGDTIEVHPAYDETAVRIELFGDEIEQMIVVDPVTGERVRELTRPHRPPGHPLRRRRGADAQGHRAHRGTSCRSGWPTSRRRASCSRPSGCGCAPSTTSR